MTIQDANINRVFLSGGGEMGELIRNNYWKQSSLGSPEFWPQSLRTTLSIMLNSKFPMFLWWGPELICFYNDAYRPSLGKDGKHPSILGMPAKDAWEEIWDVIKPLIDKVIEEKEAIWFEDLLVPIYRNGTIEDVYWTFSYSPVLDDLGNTAGVLVTCTETTEKIYVKKKLEESQQRFRSLIIQSPIAMVVFKGPEHTVEIVNIAMLKRWNKTEGDMLNKRLIDAFPNINNSKFPHIMDQVYKTGKAYRESESISFLQNDSKTLYVDFEYSPIIEPDGRVSGIIAIVNDVTEIVEARTKAELRKNELVSLSESLEKKVLERTIELEQKNTDLEKMNKELQSFAYISSHDLQEPLRKIQTFSTRIIQKEFDNLSENGKNLFKRMNISADRMQKLIDDLLAYSRTSTSERKFELVDISEIIAEVKDDLKDEINEKKAIIDTSGTCIINIIRFQFRQLLQNIIGNALKFSSPERSLLIKIKCSIENGAGLNHSLLIPDKNYFHFSIADNGIGFEQEFHDKIFELFQRLQGKDKYPGTGIGLAIVKKIVENHNGIITATGKINEGATFDIYLPMQ